VPVDRGPEVTQMPALVPILTLADLRNLDVGLGVGQVLVGRPLNGPLGIILLDRALPQVQLIIPPVELARASSLSVPK
jgi:hypothetical protein